MNGNKKKSQYLSNNTTNTNGWCFYLFNKTEGVGIVANY